MSTSQISSLQALCGSLLGITTLTCGFRFYARYIQRAGLGPDDWMIVPAFIAFIGIIIIMLLGINLGYWGSTDKQVAADHIPFFTEVSLIISMDILSIASLGFSRISALFFYRRIFAPRGHSQPFRKILHATIGITTLWMIAFIILFPLQCPISLWGAPPAVRTAYGCSSLGGRITLGAAISDLLLEIWAIALPIPHILMLRTSLKRRLAVLFVFLTAFVSLGSNAARLGITYQQEHGLSADKTQINTTNYFAWTLEAGFAIIAVNLPSLWWIKHKVKPENILASIRSVLSLQSLRSRGSHGSGDKSSYDRGAGSAMRPIGKVSKDGSTGGQGGTTDSMEQLADEEHAEDWQSTEGRVSSKRSEDRSLRGGSTGKVPV